MMGWNDGWAWGWLALCTTMLLVVGALIAAVVLMAGRAWPAPLRRSPAEDPQRILDQRLARGELTEAQYLSATSALAARAVGGGTR
jgi:putative membrane protein